MYAKHNKVIAVVTTVVILTFCSLATASQKKTITHLTLPNHSESWQAYLHEMAELFEQAYPEYEIDIQVGALDKFLVMAAGGVSPDVLDLATTSAGSLLADGMLLDLSPFINRNADARSRFPDHVLDALTSPDGTLFMLPVDMLSMVTWYDLDLLNETGLTPPAELGNDWTWDVLREYGQKLTRRTDDGTVQKWGLDRMRNRPYIQALQAGGSFFDRDIFPTESHVLSDPVVNAIEFIERLIWEDQVTQPGGIGQGTYFWDGMSAISVVDGPGIIGTRMQGVPFRWDVAQQPRGSDNNATFVGLNGFEISALTDDPEAAWKWVEFIATTEDAQRRFVSHTGRLPVFREVAIQWDRLIPDEAPENWMAIFEQAVHLRNIHLAYGITQDDRMHSALTTQLGHVWRGRTSARIALEEADRQIRQLLEEVK